jgi:aryl-alcohol dehydrogenase-like predicted oxidoreductase
LSSIDLIRHGTHRDVSASVGLPQQLPGARIQCLEEALTPTGAFRSVDAMTASGFRRTLPRFTNEHLTANARIVDVVKAVAARHQATPAQIALAWVLGQGKDVVPIPGTKRRQYLDENLGAIEVQLNSIDLADLNPLASIVSGERYATTP